MIQDILEHILPFLDLPAAKNTSQVCKMFLAMMKQSPHFWSLLCCELLNMDSDVWDLIAKSSHNRYKGRSTELKFWMRNFGRLKAMRQKAQELVQNEKFVSSDLQYGKYSSWCLRRLSASWIMGFLLSVGTLRLPEDESAFNIYSDPSEGLRADDAVALERVLRSCTEPVPARALPPQAFDVRPLKRGAGRPTFADLEDVVFWAEGFTSSDIFGLVWQVG
jgi:hypothetical protein